MIPALAEVGAAYDLGTFHTSLRTGVGMTPRNFGLMRQVAKSDLRMLTGGEIDAIQTYLIREQNQSPAQ